MPPSLTRRTTIPALGCATPSLLVIHRCENWTMVCPPLATPPSQASRRSSQPCARLLATCAARRSSPLVGMNRHGLLSGCSVRTPCTSDETKTHCTTRHSASWHQHPFSAMPGAPPQHFARWNPPDDQGDGLKNETDAQAKHAIRAQAHLRLASLAPQAGAVHCIRVPRGDGSAAESSEVSVQLLAGHGCGAPSP